MNIYPLVTIVSPCYNHSKYIIESLNSIRNQRYPNIEHIIIDDASTDESVTLIEDWIDSNNYKCTFIKHEKNQGISKTLNESIVLAEGKYWSPLATDDFIHEDRTTRFVEYLENHVSTVMVASDCSCVDEDSKLIEKNGTTSFLTYYTSNRDDINEETFGTYKTLLRGNYMPGSIMIRKQNLIDIGKFPENMKLEDWDTWLRISAKSRIAYIKDKLTFYRWHNSNSIITGNFLKDYINTLLKQKEFCYASKELKKVWKELHRDIVKNHYNIRKSKNREIFLRKDQLADTIKAYFYINLDKLGIKRSS